MMKTKDRLLLFACWFYLINCVYISVYCYAFERLNRNFRCHSSSHDRFIVIDYIRNELFCDGNEQCIDGEDELFGCKNEGNNTCGKGKFACDNGQCKNITVRCNTIKDCNDGTDELNCGDEINVKNCTSEDKFLCHDGLRCLGLENTCDQSCNCFDCSDENENCSKNDYNLMKQCPHAYFVTADGPKCLCDPNNNSSATLCNSLEDCAFAEKMTSETGGHIEHCEQRCIKYKSRSQCACYEGYYMVNGSFGSKCVPSDDFTILYLNRLEIKTVNSTYYNTSTILHGISNGTLLAAANDYVYYATLSHDNKGSIFKASLHFGKPEKLIETDYAITSIEVDYITNNIYFTGNGSLSVCTNNGTICTQLKCCNVTYLTLAPKSGLIFYTQMNTHHQLFCNNRVFLTRSNMDGSNETIRPNHCYDDKTVIKMDESKNMLYLLEGFNEKEPNSPKSKLCVMPVINSPFKKPGDNLVELHIHYGIEIQRISPHKSEMFFTTKERHGIFSYRNLLSREGGKYGIYLDRLVRLNDASTLNITDVYVYNAAIQRSNENPCEKSPLCSGLCLLKGQNHSSQFFLSRTCICEGFTPTEDGHWCSNHTLYGANYGVVWVVVLGILVFVILGITGYYMLMNGNWLRYYLLLRHLRQWESERDEVMVFDNQKK